MFLYRGRGGLRIQPTRVAGPGHTGANGRAVEALDHQCLKPVLQLANVLDLGHCPDVSVIPTLEAGNKQEFTRALLRGGHRSLGFGRLKGERHHHVRQDHTGGQRKKGKNLCIQSISHKVASPRLKSLRPSTVLLPPIFRACALEQLADGQAEDGS